tara:strand:- start:195 stop:902 length:708 start_codon:yes stop_codon:yes gene_type:complete
MYDESKLIFFTGAPGSKWSAIANIIAKNEIMPINISDYRDDRVYTHTRVPVQHLGAYWGPGNEHGKKFDQLETLSKEEIISEIDAAYTDKTWDKYRIVKCHHFALQLDYIKETFPLSKIFLVLRTEPKSFRGWKGAGGFESITYPDYHTYYRNYERLKEKIHQEVRAANNFVGDNKLRLSVCDRYYFKERWGIESQEEYDWLDFYISSVEKSQPKQRNNFESRYVFDINICEYNF